MSVMLAVLDDGETYSDAGDVTIVEVDDEVYEDDFDGKMLKAVLVYGEQVEGITIAGVINPRPVEELVEERMKNED